MRNINFNMTDDTHYVVRLGYATSNFDCCAVNKSRFDYETRDFLDSVINSHNNENYVIAAQVIINKWNEYHVDKKIDDI